VRLNKVACPVCISKNVEKIWSFKDVVPVSNFIFNSKKKAKDIRLGQIDLTFCHECGFIYNSCFSNTLCDYGSGEYNNDQTESQYFNQYLNELASELSEKYNLENKEIIEVGCGNGKFLKFFSGSSCTGIDPALKSTHHEKNVYFKRGYAVAEDLKEKDYLLCRHTLEHIPDPKSFVDNLFMDCQIPNLYFEIPRFGYLVDKNAYNALTYEHCSWYSTKSINILFSDHGYKFNAINKDRFNTEYLSVELSKMNNGMNNYLKARGWDIDVSASDLLSFCKKYSFYYDEMNNKISKYRKEGKIVAVWGVAGKGVSLLTNMVSENGIKYAIDINPDKNQMYVPKSGIQIFNPRTLINSEHSLPDIIIIINQLYQKEIQKVVMDTFNKRVEFVIA